MRPERGRTHGDDAAIILSHDARLPVLDKSVAIFAQRLGVAHQDLLDRNRSKVSVRDQFRRPIHV